MKKPKIRPRLMWAHVGLGGRVISVYSTKEYGLACVGFWNLSRVLVTEPPKRRKRKWRTE